MVVAAASGPTRPPANIEDFLWNIHTVLAAQPGPLQIDQLKDAYSKHLGHKCAIERFLVVGEGGLGATLKRIPHIVSLSSDNGTTFVKATQPPDISKQQLIEADAAYRRELIKKNAAAKAKAVAGSKPPAAATAAPKAAGATGAAAPGGAAEPAAAAKATPAAADGQAKRPVDGQAATAGDAKKARSDDADTLARMLVQGVVRVLQNRQKAGKGPLPVTSLEEEFKALWKVPFNLQQAGESDAVTFLQKWPNKVEVYTEGSVQMVQLSKKGQDKPKAAAAPPKATEPVTAAKATTGAPPPSASKATAAAKAPVAAAKNGPSIPKRAGGPTRPPASIEDFLWNIHTVIEAYGGPMPIDQLKEAYSKHLGHKCAIERFLVVGEGGLAATLKRIPHIVAVVAEKDGSAVLKATLPPGTTKEALIAADHQYRKQLQQKNQAAREAASKAKQLPVAGAATQGAAAAPAAAAPPAPAAAGAAAPAAGAATTATPAAPATAVKAPAAQPAAAAPATTAAQKRPAEGAAGEPDAKKSRGEDADTLARMLVQGIVRVLQNRQREGKGPLPVSNLEEEFKALWKVPFNLQQAGESDAVTFLQKWPNKVEVVSDGPQQVVQLAKKAAEKAKAAGVPAATKASAPTSTAAAAKLGAAGAPPVKTAAASPPKAATPAAVPEATVATTSAATAAAATTAATTAGRQAPAKDGAAAAGGPSAAVARAAPGTAERSGGAAAAGAIVASSGEATAGIPRTLPELREQAASMLQAMQEMVQRQEALVTGLQRLSATESTA